MSGRARSWQDEPEDRDSAERPALRPSESERLPKKIIESRSQVSTSILRMPGTRPAGARDFRSRKQLQLLALFEKIDGLGTWEVDVASQTLTVSANLCKLLGYQPGTRFRPDDYWSMVLPADRDETHTIAMLALHTRTSYEYTARIYTADRSLHWHIISGLPLTGEDGELKQVIGIYRDITNEARADDQMRKLSHRLMHVRDAERRSIARELHDSTGQTLAALKMDLARLDAKLPADGENGRELIRSCRELAGVAAQEVRTIAYLMHPPMLDEAGLNSALRWLARGFEVTGLN